MLRQDIDLLQNHITGSSQDIVQVRVVFGCFFNCIVKGKTVHWRLGCKFKCSLQVVSIVSFTCWLASKTLSWKIKCFYPATANLPKLIVWMIYRQQVSVTIAACSSHQKMNVLNEKSGYHSGATQLQPLHKFRPRLSYCFLFITEPPNKMQWCCVWIIGYEPCHFKDWLI